jgi:hypothetical protein
VRDGAEKNTDVGVGRAPVLRSSVSTLRRASWAQATGDCPRRSWPGPDSKDG